MKLGGWRTGRIRGAKNTLLRKAQEHETLRREFLALQEMVKNEEISIPFEIYDGRCCACSNF